MSAGACGNKQRAPDSQEPWPQPQTVVSFLAQVLGTEFRSSRRAVSTSNPLGHLSRPCYPFE